MLLRFIHVILERAGHGTEGKYFLILLLISQHKHSILIVIPVPGDLIEITLGHQRRLGADIAPLIIFQILYPSLQLFEDDHTLWHQKRQPLADHIHGGKQFHLTAQLVVIPLLCLFQHV